MSIDSKQIGDQFIELVRQNLERLNELPSQNWVETGICFSSYDEYFAMGCAAAILGIAFKDDDDYPFWPSYHERDTTSNDECNYRYYSGYQFYCSLEYDSLDSFLNMIKGSIKLRK